MAGLPTVQVLLDDGTGTFPYDISSKARIGHTISRGRQDELSSVTAGNLSNLTLDNTDGRFTPGSTIIASPSPIKADAKIRVKVTANATTVNRFTGYVQSWPVGWPTGGQTLSEVTLTATDAQARGERRVLRSVVEEEIMADSPQAYYTLGEPAGAASVADSSGNQAPGLTMAGSGTDVVFGAATGSSVDGLTAATFAGGKYLQGAITTVSGAFNWGLAVAFNVAAPPATVSTLLAVSASGTPTASISVLTDGKVRYSSDAGPVTTATSFADGGWHIAEVRSEFDLYVDGTFVGTLGGSVPTVPTVLTLGALPDGTQLLSGSLAHATLAKSLTAARALAHYQAFTTGFAGESGTARITRLAGYAGLPLGTLDASLTSVPFTDITSKSATGAILEVVDAEFGLAFYDGAGNLTFHNRNKVAAKTAADIALDVDQLDPGATFTTDMQGVINYFESTAAGTSVAQVVRDTTSETSHGRYSQSTTYLVSTNAEALDRANWIVATHKEPGPRAGTLVLDLLTMTAAQQAALLAVEPNHWLQVMGLPSQTPGGTTVNFVVQGWTESLTKDAWTLTLNVVDKTTVYPSAWILDNATYSVLDSTTRLYV